MIQKHLHLQTLLPITESWQEELSRDKKYKEATQKRSREQLLRGGLEEMNENDKNGGPHFFEEAC